MEELKVGIIGCGKICGAYLQNLTGKLPGCRVTACADLDIARARAQQEAYPGVTAMTPEALLGDPSIDLVLNLTTPGAHHDVALAAVRAGKHVYNEKPLTATPEEAKSLLDAARVSGVRVGGAPDTFLGAGIQRSVQAVLAGSIGRPVAFQACMMSRGHESWHPDPEFYYQAGGGPLLDMGPYYITALVAMLGPVVRVGGMAGISFPERTITSQPKAGNAITVEVPTHVIGLLEFDSGVMGSLTTTFDVCCSDAPRIEIFGSEATLSVPDPNSFGGPVRIRASAKETWQDLPLESPYAENTRGLGVAELADALRAGRAHRASGALAGHVLDVMHGILAAARSGTRVEPASKPARPEPFPHGL